MELPPACTVWSSMAVMVGGLSLGSVTVRVKVSVSVKPSEVAVMMMVMAPGIALLSGAKRRSAVPLSLVVSVA